MVNIYTYSSAKGLKRQNAKVGYILSTQTQKGEATLYGFETIENVTVNQSELQVLILALKRMNKKSILHIYTENMYLANAAGKWLESWKRNNWKGAKGKPVANLEKWQELDKLLAGQEYTFHVQEDHAYRKWLKNEVNGKGECEMETDKKTRYSLEIPQEDLSEEERERYQRAVELYEYRKNRTAAHLSIREIFVFLKEWDEARMKIKNACGW